MPAAYARCASAAGRRLDGARRDELDLDVRAEDRRGARLQEPAVAAGDPGRGSRQGPRPAARLSRMPRAVSGSSHWCHVDSGTARSISPRMRRQSDRCSSSAVTGARRADLAWGGAGTAVEQGALSRPGGPNIARGPGRVGGRRGPGRKSRGKGVNAARRVAFARCRRLCTACARGCAQRLATGFRGRFWTGRREPSGGADLPGVEHAGAGRWLSCRRCAQPARRTPHGL